MSFRASTSRKARRATRSAARGATSSSTTTSSSACGQRPGAYLDVLRGYDCVLTPDFSLYMDMPDAMREWNRYRSAALGWYWAQNGMTVVPTLSWAQPSSYRFCFKGIPKHSTVATSTVGVARDKEAQKVWHDGMREAMKRLEPSRVLLYGKNIGFDFGDCEVVEYKAGVFVGR